jgi:2-dehydropantoate 2-reductase
VKICIVGAGGIGATLGARLALSGHDVCVLARNAHLQAIQAHGLRLVDLVNQVERTVPLPASAEPAALAFDHGVPDLVIIGLKAHAIGAMLPRLAPLVGTHTVVVPAINGLPWWYFHREGGDLDGTAVRALDPQGRMFAALDPDHLLGCVVHIAAEVRAPGSVHYTGGRRLVLGEPDRSDSPRLRLVCGALREAGFDAVASADIRHDVWVKLIGNLSFNPVAALTGYLMNQICADDHVLEVIRAVMLEGMAVAAAYGQPMHMTVDQRIDLARQLGAARISMLQDLEQRRPLELDAIVAAVLELGAHRQIAMPATRMVHALTVARCRALGILPDPATGDRT